MQKRYVVLALLLALLGGTLALAWGEHEGIPLVPSSEETTVAPAGDLADAPVRAEMPSAVAARIDSLMAAGIEARAFPGAAVAVGRGDDVLLLKGYGRYTYEGGPTVTPQSVFDIASLTKVVATTAAAMKLYEAGRLDLDAPVADYLPGFEQGGKAAIEIRHLLSHTSGIHRAFFGEGIQTREGILEAVYTSRPRTRPGTEARYSDYNFVTLALVVEALTGERFATYTRTNLFEPLGMKDTGFRGVDAPDTSVVPTEFDRTYRRRLMQGEVHDETAWALGGAAGHAGLFSTAADLARFARLFANEGELEGRRFFAPETVRLFTTAVAPHRHTRALGWDTRSPEGYSSAGTRFGPNAFGHTGFTGTSLWIDPDQDLWVLLLTNRVYPSRSATGHTLIRSQLADLAYQVVEPAPATPVLVEE